MKSQSTAAELKIEAEAHKAEIIVKAERAIQKELERHRNLNSALEDLGAKSANDRLRLHQLQAIEALKNAALAEVDLELTQQLQGLSTPPPPQQAVVPEVYRQISQHR